MILGIYGFGGLGREVYLLAKRINHVYNRWEDIVFIDDNASLTSDKYRIESFDQFVNRSNDSYEISIAVGNPATRELLFKKVKSHNIRCATLVHPDVYVDDSTVLGEGCTICEGVTITCDVSLGDDVYVQPHAVIGHDIQIGKHSMIGANSEIGGADIIGDRFYLGFNAGTKELLTIGNDVICSAGAIVFRDLPDEVIAVGNPARIMRKNEDKQVFGK